MERLWFIINPSRAPDQAGHRPHARCLAAHLRARHPADRRAGPPPTLPTVYVTAADDMLDVAGKDARDWRAILELGWDFLTGGWWAARAVTAMQAHRLGAAGRTPVLASFDGEEQRLAGGVPITASRTHPRFLNTKANA